MPKTREDAEILYGDDGAIRLLSTQDVKYCLVFEVLKDETPILGGKTGRFGDREQRWTAVEVTPEGVGLVSAFQERGTMRGLGLERERVLDVGGVARIYGFGGRRV